MRILFVLSDLFCGEWDSSGVRPVQAPDRCGDRRMTARGRSPSPPPPRYIQPCVFEGLGACAIGVKFWMGKRSSDVRFSIPIGAPERSICQPSRRLVRHPHKGGDMQGRACVLPIPSASSSSRPGLRVPGIFASWSHNMYGMRKPFMK